MGIEFRSVYFNYGNNSSILRNVCFHLHSKSFQFLTGPSGSGKTTIVNLILRKFSPSSGFVLIDGKKLCDLDENRLDIYRSSIGYIPQNPLLAEKLDVFENLAVDLNFRRVNVDNEKSNEIREILTWVGLGNRMNNMPSELSSGERQRVAIARAVINNPVLILADEPTANIDPAMANRMMSLFIELSNLGKIVLFVTHDVNLMDKYNARRMIISEGVLNTYV